MPEIKPEILLEVKNLSIVYSTEDGVVKALNDANITIQKGESLGLVGETGAGKTTLARGIMRLIPNPPGKIISGEILYDGKDLLKLSDREIRGIRGSHISMIFQDPMTSLNPVMTVGDQILEVIRTHNPGLSLQEAKQQTEDMMEMVGINGQRHGDYPHQFSGGMKQRIVIAIALACNPKLLIADEPTTALDVTIQAQVLEMIYELKQRNNTSMLLITHDLGVVAQNCDRVAIVYAGEIVECGTLHQVYKQTAHPYTIGLIHSIPSLTGNAKRLSVIEGMMPDPTALPDYCKFANRCKFATDQCRQSNPPLRTLPDGHQVRCFNYEASQEAQ